LRSREDLHLSRAFVLAGTQASPGNERSSRRKAAHVAAYCGSPKALTPRIVLRSSIKDRKGLWPEPAASLSILAKPRPLAGQYPGWSDDEGEAGHNERLTLTGIEAGRFDVNLGDKKGRVCMIKNVEVQEKNPVTIRDG
jgi:hypothetical protein